LGQPTSGWPGARLLAVNQTAKRRVVVIAFEKNGKSLPFVFKTDPKLSKLSASGPDRFNRFMPAKRLIGMRSILAILTKRINHRKRAVTLALGLDTQQPPRDADQTVKKTPVRSMGSRKTP